MTTLRNTATRYGWVAILLHWSMALLIIGMLILGLYMTGLPVSLKKLKYYGWHKEWGTLVFMLAMLRILWRVGNPPPPLPAHMPTWQKWAAHSTHICMYLLMLLMPLTGWLLSSSAGFPVSFFGLFVLPDFVSANEAMRLLFTQMHKWLGYGLIALICAHVGAALQHHFIYKDDILRRIL